MIKKRDKNAITYSDIHYSYSDLMQYSLRYSEVFKGKYENPEKVMIFSENSAEYIFAIYGVLRLNAAVVPVDVMATAKEFRYMVNDCRPEIIITSKEKFEFAKEAISDIENYNVCLMTFDDVDTSAVSELPLIELDLGAPDQVVSIIYTSGTTGSPKGVMLTYENYWYNVDAIVNQVPIFTDKSNTILLLPLHHVFPFAGVVLATIYAGGTIHIAPNLAPETIIKTLKDGKVSIIIGVPRLYDALAKGIMTKIKASFAAHTLYKLAKLINSKKFSKIVFKSVHEKFGGHVKSMVCGGAALSIETGTIFKTLGFEMLEGFGMTECAPMISFTHLGDWKLGYCGKVLKGCEVRFSDENEILIKGPNVMKGYYNRPEETAAIIRNGWLHSGDIGEFDRDGRLKVTGRIKEIIVTPNGKNINPVEIEHAVVAEAKSINDIAVFLHEEIIQAVVIPNMNAVRVNTAKTIEECVREDIEAYNLTCVGYKKIMKFHITSQEIPKTRLGKIQRFKLNDFVVEKKEDNIKEDLSEKSKAYLSIKKIIDNETEKYAYGDDHLEIDLAMDSLSRVSLLAYIEENFGVNIDESQMNELSTLNKLAAYVEEHASEENISTISWKKIFEETKGSLALPKSGFLHWFMFNFVKIGFRLFYRLKRRGFERIPKGACIFAANHRSGFDPAYITAALKWNVGKKIYFFAKEKHFKSSFAKFIAKRNNIILVDVNSNIKKSLQQMYQVLKEGNSIIIFPEGTRSKDAVMKEFKESFAILSKELSVPVVPVTINGSEYATYRSIRIPRFLTSVNVEILPSIVFNKNESVKDFTSRVRGAIKQKLDSMK